MKNWSKQDHLEQMEILSKEREYILQRLQKCDVNWAIHRDEFAKMEKAEASGKAFFDMKLK